MPIKSPPPRRTMWDVFPQVTKLPKPWKLFVHQPRDWKAVYPKYGETVLCTDGKVVWTDKWFDQELSGAWNHCFAWCRLPKAPDLGLVWPPKVELPPPNKEQLEAAHQPATRLVMIPNDRTKGMAPDYMLEDDIP